MAGPDLICIGAQRSGTTWLYHQLRQIEGICLPPVKEFHYFDRSESYPSPNKLSKTHLSERIFVSEWQRQAIRKIFRTGMKNGIREAIWCMRFFTATYSDEWYQKNLTRANCITGDFTPAYSILNEEDIERMKMLAPDARIIMLVRDPIQRAWSHYIFKKLRGKVRDLSELTFDDFKTFITSPEQQLRSDYTKIFERYRAVFHDDRFKVYYYDALINQPEQLLKSVLTYLNVTVDSVNLPSLSTRYNQCIQHEIPETHLHFLKEHYEDLMFHMAESHGGYAIQWYDPVLQKTSVYVACPNSRVSISLNYAVQTFSFLS